MSDYIARATDARLKSLVSRHAAVAIDGAKGVGKTSSALQIASSQFALDDIAQAQNVAADANVLLTSMPPVLIDEWQRVPQVWDFVRRQVDVGAKNAQFILAGSAIPRGATVHSGAGRIVHLRMRPLALSERNLATPSVSLADLLEDPPSKVEGTSSVGLAEYIHEITASGLPGLRGLDDESVIDRLDGYIENLVTREFAEQGLVVRKPAALTEWMRAYAAATGSTATYTSILDAATPGIPDTPSRNTANTYRDALASSWVLDPIPAWTPSFSQFGALGSSPKHFFLDPALAARLLGLSETRLIRGSSLQPLGPQGGTILGRLFESLMALSLQTYAVAARANLFHFRTSDTKREVDFIVERDFDIVAIEVKLASAIDDDDVRHLNWLAANAGGRQVTRVIVSTGPAAYTRTDGVHVIPAALLGP